MAAYFTITIEMQFSSKVKIKQGAWFFIMETK
jgi:hypothetical protein